jgi:putative nucleotidyltransferase with HDIG domain
MARDTDPTSVTEIRPAANPTGGTGAIRLRKRTRPRDLWELALDKPLVWLAAFLILGTWCLQPGAFHFSNRVQTGAIADHDYVASRDLLLNDDEATVKKQREARDAVLPVYDLDPGALAERDSQMAQLFSQGRGLLAAGGGEAAREEAVRTLSSNAESPASPQPPSALKLTVPQAELLARKGFSPDLEDRLRGALTQVLRRGVVANKELLLENRLRGVTLRNLATSTERAHFDLFDHVGYPGEARDLFETEVRSWGGLSVPDRRLLVDLLAESAPPNLLLNRSETLLRQDSAAAGVGQVFNQIRQGQVIVRKGDPIDAVHARIIAQMQGERLLGRRLPPLAATLALLALVAGVVWLSQARERVANHDRGRLFGESLLLLLISLLGTKFGFVVAGALAGAFDTAPMSSVHSYAYAIPFAAAALVAMLLLGRNIALMTSVLISVLAARLTGEDALWVVFYSLAGSLAAIYTLEGNRVRHRLVMVRVGLVVGGVNLAMVLILTALGPGGRGLWQVGFDLICAFAGGLAVTAAASFALPILEWALGITTDIKLVELSNTNLPLLRRLAFEAPGTFQHSLMVANLAKEGCEAIGADPVLAYAAGLYHDVGKVLRPDYFIENQRPGHNRHDKLLPSMSALILINHVKDGVELARQHNLPRVIADAVEQHHGTRLMKFFYSKAVEQKDPDATDVTDEKYRYPGPRPQTREMGVLMIADAVEAASRTLTEGSPAKIRGLIRTIVDDCLHDGQLDYTDLTLSDLRAVSESFLRVLTNIFHQRIDYPGYDFNAQPTREKKPIRLQAS